MCYWRCAHNSGVMDMLLPVTCDRAGSISSSGFPVKTWMRLPVGPCIPSPTNLRLVSSGFPRTGGYIHANLTFQMNIEKLQKMAGAVRTGGKGSVRRKKKAVHKTTTTDDKRLQNTLKRLGVNTIPGIEEVNIFKDDTVIHFTNPKVQASISANTYVVSGNSQTKKLEDLLPGILNQLAAGGDNLQQLKKIAQQFQSQAAGGDGAHTGGDDNDDDVPDLVENFEDAAKAAS
eukprot:jgi/Mesvir1/4509/Mv03788-RA.1